ncbi:MAG: hypothetical protein RR763_13940, partial [Massilia sp.]
DHGLDPQALAQTVHQELHSGRQDHGGQSTPLVKACDGKLPRQCRAMIKTTTFQYGAPVRRSVLTRHPGSAILARC